MKRIGLTQRVEIISHYGERRDCLDQNWAQLLETCGYLPVPLSNTIKDVPAYLEELCLSGIIMTGGNDIANLPQASNIAPERDEFERKLLTFALEKKMPLLGICRGMQLMNLYFGGQLERLSGHVATRHLVNPVENAFVGSSTSFEVNSYHNFGIPSIALAPPLISLAQAPDNTVEALRHTEASLYGMMWHPEREVPFHPADLKFLSHVFEGKCYESIDSGSGPRHTPASSHG